MPTNSDLIKAWQFGENDIEYDGWKLELIGLQNRNSTYCLSGRKANYRTSTSDCAGKNSIFKSQTSH